MNPQKKTLFIEPDLDENELFLIYKVVTYKTQLYVIISNIFDHLKTFSFK